MNVPFTKTEYDKFTDFHCAQSGDFCEKCTIRKECAPYCDFERGFALNDKTIIDKGLRFAQKMNSKNYTIFRIEKENMGRDFTYNEAEEFVKECQKNSPTKKYIIELTKNS